MALIFDSHAHYDSAQFDSDRPSLLSSFKDNGVGFVMSASSSVKSSKKNSELAKSYPFIFASAGVHPIDCKFEEPEYLSSLRELIKDNKKIVAIGETGLDYHYDTPKDLQKRFFIEQLELAKEFNKPVIIHSREATEDTLSILKEYRPKGVVHCFSGSPETAKIILDLGLYIGFTGVVTFKNAAKTVKSAEYVPLDRLLIETDCPYMAPVPFRGQRCDSTMLHKTAEKLAEIKGVSKECLIEKTRDNAIKVFELEGLI